MRNRKWELKDKIWPHVLKAVFISFLLILTHMPFSTFAYASVSPEIITAIEVRGASRIKEDDLIDLVSLSAGDMLDRQKLSKGIKRAFKKGIFHDIQAVSLPSDGGIKLVYIVKEISLVEKIVVKGNEIFFAKKIKDNFYFKEGEDYQEDFLDSARSGLYRFYERKGYPDAEIKITVEEYKKAAVRIYINVKAGPPLIIKKLDVTSEVGFIMKTAEDSIFDRDVMDKELERIEAYYKKKNHINSKAGPYQFSNGVLTVPVYVGPALEIEFKHNDAVSSRKLKKELTFLEEGEVTDESVSDTAERIRLLYVSKGYYYAQVAASVKREEDLIRVLFVIFEGERVVLRTVRFSGNTIIPDALKKILPLKEDKYYNDNLLDDGRESLIRFYNALGYLRADVTEVEKEFKNNGLDLDLEFIIHEGPQTRIRSIAIEGNEKIGTAQIRDVLKLFERIPYNAVDIGDARHRVISLYGRRGYMDAEVEVKSVIEKEHASLTFRIQENNPIIIGKIILRGNNKTKDKIIYRDMTFEESESYNHEEITRTKQRLYRLGIFNEVSIDMLEGGQELEAGVVKDMLVTVKEANPGSVEITGGYGDYEGVRGSVDIKYRNLGGYNRQVGSRTMLSDKDKRHVFSFREPWFLNKPNLLFRVSLTLEDRDVINIETRDVLYKVEKQSFVAGIEKEIVENLKAGLDYEYSFTDTKDVEEDIILTKEDTGTLRIGSISPSLFYDTRDNPFNPTSGSQHGVVVKYASDIFLSETDFIKGTVQSAWFFQIMKRVVFAFSLRGGAAYGFDESEEIPLIERFFLGGRSTVRGYKHEALGPKGENDDPTGGNVFALTNLELRFNMGKGFGLVTFVDGGEVWQTFDEVDGDLKYTTGAGLRYNTPVGPVRLDYGYKLNREPDESIGEFHFSFGHAF
jgi:outer membrane protein insertion porin family